MAYIISTPKKFTSNNKVNFEYELSEVCAKLQIPLFGVLLYHSSHSRMKNFLAKNYSFLDIATGSNLFLMTIIKPVHRLQILDDYKDDELKDALKEFRVHNNEIINEDHSFTLAKHLNIKRTNLPALVLYKSNDGQQPLIVFRFKDDWFPKDKTNIDEENKTKEWLLKLFDKMDEFLLNNSKRIAVKKMRREFLKIAYRNNHLEPIFKFISDNLLIPFSILSSIPRIIEKVGLKIVEKKIGE